MRAREPENLPVLCSTAQNNVVLQCRVQGGLIEHTVLTRAQRAIPSIRHTAADGGNTDVVRCAVLVKVPVQADKARIQRRAEGKTATSSEGGCEPRLSISICPSASRERYGYAPDVIFFDSQGP